MQSVNIQTTQNVAIGYEVAGVGDRILATLIDSAVLLAYGITVTYLLVEGGFDSIWIFISFYLPIFFYHLFSEIFLQGQSFGKKVLKIKVVKLDGSNATIGAYVLRWITRLIEVDMASGSVAIVAIAMNGKGQRVGDMAAGTTVIKVDRDIAVSSHRVIQNLKSDYEPVFSQVLQLTEKDMLIIKEALKANKQHANPKPVLAATEKVKSLLNIQSELPPVKFLHTIVKDFNYLTSK